MEYCRLESAREELLPTDEEKMQSSKPLLFFGNLMIIVWIALGTAAFFLFSDLAGWVFLFFSAFSVFILVRRQMCTSCYYCKSCTKGFAKMSKLFLGGNRIPGIGKGTTIGLVVFILVVLSVIPVGLLVYSMFLEFNVLNLLLLIGILGISTYQVVARARNWYD